MADDRDASGRGPLGNDTRRTHGGLDVRVPNVARMYDYYLGGKDNFASDREAAEEALAAFPPLRAALRQNRAFLGRAVRFAADAGVRQFLDIGTGLPTQENVHQVAQRHAPGARVVYVDNDPVVLTHARALLATDAQTIVVDGDLRRPEEILADGDLRRHIDLDQPVAVLLVAILHFVTDAEDPYGVVATLRDAMAPGSYLVITHATADTFPDEASKGTEIYARASAPLNFRSHAEIARFFDGFDIVEPGLVDLNEWRPHTRKRTGATAAEVNYGALAAGSSGVAAPGRLGVGEVTSAGSSRLSPALWEPLSACAYGT